MPNGASRIFKLMQKSGTDTISEMVGLTVKSTNPLILTDGDRLNISEHFLYFDTYIDKKNIKVGDKFVATTYNSGQTYYIYDIIKSNQNIDRYLQEIEKLKEEIDNLKNRVSVLENRL